MTTLVENLLSLARADGGAETLRLAPIRLTALFCQLSELWNPVMKNAMLDFSVGIPPEDMFVLGDKQSILRLLSILLKNASRYTPPGGSVKLCSASDSDRRSFD
jgi:signal transduction histidine kinase